jgi:DnaJ-class molecular chaperone
LNEPVAFSAFLLTDFNINRRLRNVNINKFIFRKIRKVDIPKGSQNGKMLRLQKLGMPVYGKPNESGNLYLNLNIIIPRNLSEKELQLFKEMQKLREK